MYIGSQLRESVPIVRFREPFKRVGSFANVTSLSHRQTFNSISRSMCHLYLLFNKFLPTQSYYVDSEYVVCFPKYSLLENVSTTCRTSVYVRSVCSRVLPVCQWAGLRGDSTLHASSWRGSALAMRRRGGERSTIMKLSSEKSVNNIFNVENE